MSEICGNPSASLAHILMIRPGPSHHTNELEPLCRTLSTRFTGEIWVPGSYENDLTIERVRLRVVKENSTSAVRNFIDFGRKLGARIEELRRSRIGSILVDSYDPFRSGLLARWASARLRAPFVCQVNGIYGDRNIFADIGSPWQRALRSARMRLIGTLVLAGADAVKLLYDGQLDGFVRPSRRTVVRSFFDFCNVERFYQQPEEPFVLSVGYPFKIKGVDILCAAFTRIAPRLPNWKLVLIGHTIPAAVRSAGYADPRIIVLPGLSQPKVAEWMSRCSIFALASRTEAMGRVLIEAAAAGKCRVASRVGGIPTVVEDGVDGLLFKSESVEDLAARLEFLMTDSDLRGRLALAARRRAEHEFSQRAYLKSYCELVDVTLKKTSRKIPASDTGK